MIHHPLLKSDYQSSQKEYWTGRITKPEVGKQYWYQEITFVNFQNESFVKENLDVALLGYACDEGVQRNLGRVGAEQGPNAIRQQLSRLPFHHSSKNVVDFGNIICKDKDMEACQEDLALMVKHIISNDIFPIVMGGGHDVAYGHFKGIRNAIENRYHQRIGIINFDAHFDLRPREGQANSGTPFNQILEEHNGEVEYFAIGIQQQSNTRELFEIAKEKGVGYILNYDCELSNLESIKKQLVPFIKRNDWLYITIDMDGFSSAYAPGVSAPSPLGFTPYFVLKMLNYFLQTKKVLALDIAELNPKFDQDNISANLAARIVDHVIEMY